MKKIIQLYEEEKIIQLYPDSKEYHSEIQFNIVDKMKV